MRGLRLKLFPALVEVDLAVAEGQRAAIAPENYLLHAQDPSVEVDRRTNIGDGKDQMIKAINAHTGRIASLPQPSAHSPARRLTCHRPTPGHCRTLTEPRRHRLGCVRYLPTDLQDARTSDRRLQG